MVGLDFIVRPSHIEEYNKNNLSPLDYAINNAKKKGKVVGEKMPNALVISADTIVVYKSKILEKPHDESHAREILKQLSDNTHEVITGFGITYLYRNKFMFDYEKTKVTFRNLNQSEISAYVNSGEPFDKAGGYGAQGMGSLLIKKVDGCFFNVVGLPLAKFFFTLDKFLTQL
jgi:septum formation protein